MKIAVLLAGQLRNWDLISKIFKLYNKNWDITDISDTKMNMVLIMIV